MNIKYHYAKEDLIVYMLVIYDEISDKYITCDNSEDVYFSKQLNEYHQLHPRTRSEAIQYLESFYRVLYRYAIIKCVIPKGSLYVKVKERYLKRKYLMSKNTIPLYPVCILI